METGTWLLCAALGSWTSSVFGGGKNDNNLVSRRSLTRPIQMMELKAWTRLLAIVYGFNSP